MMHETIAPVASGPLFIADAQPLFEALDYLARFVATKFSPSFNYGRSDLPKALAAVRIDADASGLIVLSSCDLDLHCAVTVPGTVDVPGVMAVNAATLRDLVKAAGKAARVTIQSVGIGRAKTAIAQLDTRFAEPGNRAGTVMMLWHPIVDVLVDDVFDINRRYGIPLAESYALGSSRHSCALCIMGSLNDLTVGAEAHPWLHRHYVSMEASSTFSFQHQRWLADIRPDLLTPGLLADVDRAKAKAAERRAVELALPARHRYVDGWPLFVPTHDEARQIVDGRSVILAHHGLDDPYGSPSLVMGRFEELLAMKAAKAATKAAALERRLAAKAAA